MMKTRFVPVILGLLTTAVACGGGDSGGSVDAGNGNGDGPTLRKSIRPSAADPMYQGGQTKFQPLTGTSCTGRVAASMGVNGFCYLAANDDVMCAGKIGDVDHGMTFQRIGQTGASQILVMFEDNGMCITKSDHTVECMGTNTTALGARVTPTAFTRWSDLDDIEAIGTATWKQLCGIRLNGEVWCSGAEQLPTIAAAAGQTSMWVDPQLGLQLGASLALRPGESHTECVVAGNGLACADGVHGPTPNAIVMGTRVASGTAAESVCWLDELATVGCETHTSGTIQRFAAEKVLYLAASYYTDSICAIYNDGSIWCIGSNASGKLGTGNTESLIAERMVAPAGSARVRCDP